MIETILTSLANLLISLITHSSYLGITGLMALESANIPIPSEVVMPFSGFLVSQGTLNFWLVVLAGAAGCTLGSLGSYWLGRVSQETWVRSFVSGWGRLLISQDELNQSGRWLRRHGEVVTFFSRMLPVVRTFISFPAGMAGINLTKFLVYSFAGSFIWSVFLTYLGFSLGQNWDSLRPLFRQFDYLIVGVFIIGLVWLVYHRGKRFARTKRS